MTKHTLSDISATLSVTERTNRRWIKTLAIKGGKKILFPEDILELLKSRHENDKVATFPDIEEKQFDRVEYFTEEEYQEFHKRLVEYDVMEQLNYIESKEKKLDR